MSTKPILDFTLIHGTFARGAPWVHDDVDPAMFRCKLRSALESDYDVHYDTVSWGRTGRLGRLLDNTDRQRLHGVEELTKHLLAREDVTDEKRRFLVAHSHGGNIALYVLRDPAVRRKVSGVVCLSSPFLVHRRAPIRRDLLFFSCAVLLLVAIQGQSFALWSYFAFVAAVTALLLLAKNFGEDEKSMARIQARLKQLEIPDIRSAAADSGRPVFLAIRARKDEVGILFWLTRQCGRTFRWAWQYINRFGGWLLGVYFVVSILVALLLERVLSEGAVARFDSTRSWLDHFVLTPMLIITTSFLVVMVLMRWSYAFDAVPWLACMDVKPQVLPWSGAAKEVLPTSGWLRHSGIQSASPPAIASWIRKLDQR